MVLRVVEHDADSLGHGSSPGACPGPLGSSSIKTVIQIRLENVKI